MLIGVIADEEAGCGVQEEARNPFSKTLHIVGDLFWTASRWWAVPTLRSSYLLPHTKSISQ